VQRPAAVTAPDPSLPPNFILVDVESMRADRLGAFRKTEPLAPNMRALASQGASFSNAFSQSAWTLPGLCALLTGRSPPLMELGQLGLPWLTSEEAPSLPGLLADGGYSTAVFWGETAPAQFSEFSAGFDLVVRTEPGEAPFEGPFLRWLGSAPKEPFFVLLHNMDLHSPLPGPPEAWLHRFVLPHPACADYCNLDEISDILTPRLGRRWSGVHVRGHYDGTLAFYDDVLGRLLQAAGELALERPTVVLITSNHGEDLFDHGVLGHGLHFDSVLRIPLVIADPALEVSGLQIDQVVQTVDLAPTILARAGLPAPPGMEGASLLPLLGLAEGSYQERDVFSVTNRANASLRTARHKLLLRQVGDTQRGLQLELYDVERDPREQRDLYARRPELAEALEGRLFAWLESLPAQNPEAAVIELDEAHRRLLQERGYWEIVQPHAAPR